MMLIRLLLIVFSALGFTTAVAQDSCPATLGASETLGPPFPVSENWFGSEALAVMLPADGRWQITAADARIAVKLFIWSNGYEPGGEQHLDVRVDNLFGKINDAEVRDITNAHAESLGGWTMLAGIDFPSPGCWRVSLDYLGQSLSFVVETFDPDASPYAGQQVRNIKSLSEQQIASFLRGDGMGYAKLAELNSYPGPKHVLEIADRLDLSAEQLAETSALFDRMKRDAVKLGQELVQAEAQLDASFASGDIESYELEEALAKIAGLEGRLRNVHLQAHLRQKDLLTRQQLHRYDSIRGYTGGQEEHTLHKRQH